MPGRSIITNAGPHVGQPVIVRYDLSNFYPSVTLARITAMFRTFGYSREAAVWGMLANGIRVIVARSFADIYRENCLQNGLLPLVLAAPEAQAFAREGQEPTIYTEGSSCTCKTESNGKPPLAARDMDQLVRIVTDRVMEALAGAAV